MSRLLTTSEAEHFKQIIDNYQPDNEVLDLFERSNFAVIAGPAGAGKDTLRNGLNVKHLGTYVPILSTTTRPPRAGEIDGRDYHFREISEVEKSLRSSDFFQAELVHNQQISCLHVNEIRKLGTEQIGLSILITKTENDLYQFKPDIKTIFLIPPDTETLRQRMQAKRLLDEAEIGRRLAAAKNEISHALEREHYYCLVSAAIPDMIAKAHTFLIEGKRDEAENQRARQTMATIMLELSHD